MKVLEQGAVGVRVGVKIEHTKLGLPAGGRHGLLIVFWKQR